MRVWLSRIAAQALFRTTKSALKKEEKATKQVPLVASIRAIYFACGGLLLSGGGVVLGDVVSGGVALPGVVESGLCP
jgi:hypothetical protein